jgi:hypothetical protein
VHRDDAARYDDIVRAFGKTGDVITLYEELTAIAFDRSDVEWHVANRGKHMSIGYL